MTNPIQPSSSNNLKEQVEKVLVQVAWFGSYQRSGEEPEGPTLSPSEATLILLNLILDTILASEEMQDEDLERIHISHFEHSPACQPQLDMWVRDNFRADLRAMLEGLRNGS